ncbi:hypothetical protein, partial [Mycobacterium sp. shizuoka-1]|uniref:hypothetical protein n=1 Tax=Mycobacterium sp. shizuoka-1 TaxID=2039281 RepID=UPI001E562D96
LVRDSDRSLELAVVVYVADTFAPPRDIESHDVYHDEALTPLARLICQRASEDARVTLKLRRCFDITAANSAQSRKKNRLARATARIDSMSHHSGTRWSR